MNKKLFLNEKAFFMYAFLQAHVGCQNVEKDIFM